MSKNPESVYEKVKERYSAAAKATPGSGASCEESFIIEPSGQTSSCRGEQVPDLAGPSLGCGRPLARAGLRPGDTVLDIGSGAGLEVIEASRQVLPNGLAYGLDMTDEMLALALSNKRTAAAHNAVFIKGTMEDIPLPDGSVDVIISNCVINLSPDKPKALSELKRVLRPGGRLAIQDVVLEGVIPEDLKGDSRLWCECVSGSMSLPEYEEKLRTAGFTAISFIVDGWYEQEATAARGFRIGSAFVSAQRPTGVEPARKSDLAAIEELLKAASLPTDGVADNIEHFSLVRDGDSVIACAGVELYGGQALLRSVCVAESHRGEGWGKALTDVVQEQARRAGAREIYLLTTTAGGYFEKLGFDRVERSKLFGPVLQSVEFESACPVTATVMNKRFKTPDRQRCC